MISRTRSPLVVVAGVVLAIATVLALVVGPRVVSPSGPQPCTIGDRAAECRRVAVPENPADPGGKKIQLNVAVFRATGGKAKADPLVWFSGWGGAGVSDDAPTIGSALRRVNVGRDLVFIDQRGTGSSKLVCPVQSARALRGCAERIGPNLRYYTSAVAVDDFDRVREELGYDKINIYGGSYGVTTGLIYLLRHGAHVRTAVFDSGSLLDVRIFERAAPNAQRALDLLFGRCASDTSCQTEYPRLRSEFAAVQARVAKSPIAIPGETASLNTEGLANVVEELLATTQGKAVVPRFIHLLATGNIGGAAVLVRPFVPTSGGPLAYQLVIQCSEPWASRRPAEVNRLARGTFMQEKQRIDAQQAGAACKALPKGVAPAAIGRRVHSRVPVLFLTGNEDPADPPANVADASRELPNSSTVIFPNSGHGQLGLLCAQNLIADFIGAGTAVGLDASCATTAVQQLFATG